MYILKTTYELWEQNRAGLSITEPAKIMGRILKVAFGSREDSMDSFLEKSAHLYSLPRRGSIRSVDEWTLTVHNLFETEADRDLYELTINKYRVENNAALGYELKTNSFKYELTEEEFEDRRSEFINHIEIDNPYTNENLAELRSARKAAK